jgi:multidrug efflux pump
VGHNIVLVDTFYQLRRQGFDAADAAVRAATQRFRPVLLTTVVTVIGLLPMMFQIHPDYRGGGVEIKPPGSEWWVQLSATVVWGLSFSTVLTLFLTPAALAAPKQLAITFGWMQRPFRGVLPGRARPAVGPAIPPGRPYPEAAE